MEILEEREDAWCAGHRVYCYSDGGTNMVEDRFNPYH